MTMALKGRIELHIAYTEVQHVNRVRDVQKDPLKNLQPEAIPSVDWRFIFEALLKGSARPNSTSRHRDYSLNLGAAVDIGSLLSGASVDSKTKKVVLLITPQSRTLDSYGYICPRSSDFASLTIGEKIDQQLWAPSNYLNKTFPNQLFSRRR